MTESEIAIWEMEPQLIVWSVETWEHRALEPSSFGQSSSVSESRQILPKEMTAPIYAALSSAEKYIFRVTEPLYPFRARLLRFPRDMQDATLRAEAALSLRTAIYQGDRLLHESLSDVVPDWDERVEQILRDLPDSVVANGREWPPHGIPRADFSVAYGYRITLRVLGGTQMDPRVATHRSLLMGSNESFMPPGESRDVVDKLIR